MTVFRALRRYAERLSKALLRPQQPFVLRLSKCERLLVPSLGWPERVQPHGGDRRRSCFESLSTNGTPTQLPERPSLRLCQDALCRGFTLPEVLISTLTFGIIAAALVGLYSLGMRSADRQGRDSQTLADGQRTLALMEKDVIEACGATSVTGFAASPSALALLMPRFDGNGLLVASTDVVVYYFSGNRLLRDVRPGSGSSLSSVTGQVILDYATGSPVFDYLRDQGTSLVRVSQVQQAEVVRVRLQASASVGTDRDGQYFRGEYRMRNKR